MSSLSNFWNFARTFSCNWVLFTSFCTGYWIKVEDCVFWWRFFTPFDLPEMNEYPRKEAILKGNFIFQPSIFIRDIWMHFQVAKRLEAQNSQKFQFILSVGLSEKDAFPWCVSPQIMNGVNLKIIQLKRNIIFQPSFFGFHANLPGCLIFCSQLFVNS